MSSQYLRLLRHLAAEGWLTGPWQEVFAAFPRQWFIPDQAWASNGSGPLRALDRQARPSEWAKEVNSDVVIATRVDDGGRVLVSSSMPSMVARMMRYAELADRSRVLEIGTGTGWSAALLSARLGEARVTSVEIDTEAAQQARQALETVGYRPHLVVGDGEQGHLPTALYDRVISTCAVTRVPWAWVAQTRVGGLVLTPWRGRFAHQGMLLRLMVSSTGTASGRFLDWSAFMMSRPQYPPTAEVPVPDQGGDSSVADIHPGFAVDGEDAEIAVGLMVGDCQWWHEPVPGDDSGYVLRLDDVESGSWAVVGPILATEPGPWPVRQGGRRRLWDEVEAAYRWWIEQGRPAATRFGMTVGPGFQQPWLDHPSRRLPTLVPAGR